MNNALLDKLLAAREELVLRQRQLAIGRRAGISPEGIIYQGMINNLYLALDRVWELQCMMEVRL